MTSIQSSSTSCSRKKSETMTWLSMRSKKRLIMQLTSKATSMISTIKASARPMSKQMGSSYSWSNSLLMSFRMSFACNMIIRWATSIRNSTRKRTWNWLTRHLRRLKTQKRSSNTCKILLSLSAESSRSNSSRLPMAILKRPAIALTGSGRRLSRTAKSSSIPWEIASEAKVRNQVLLTAWRRIWSSTCLARWWKTWQKRIVWIHSWPRKMRLRRKGCFWKPLVYRTSISRCYSFKPSGRNSKMNRLQIIIFQVSRL